MQENDRLSIISFDVSRDSATKEQSEDRSLNLLLRRRRLRSEIFRLALSPTDDQLELLAEILANGPSRPMVFLARHIEHYPAQQNAIARIAPYGTEVLIVLIGSSLQAWSDVTIQAEWMTLASDDTENIMCLAEKLLTPTNNS
jgi:hypothetical protein